MKALGLALAMLLAVGGTIQAQTTQQQRMTDCNQAAAAGAYKGDQRKSFMSQCLSGGGAKASTVSASKEKSCTADADAKKLAGAARNSFMKKCVGS